MLSRIRNQFSSQCHDDYEPVQSDDGPNLPPLEIHRQRPQRGEMQSRSGGLVVACFWALGAGILLSWNDDTDETAAMVTDPDACDHDRDGLPSAVQHPSLHVDLGLSAAASDAPAHRAGALPVHIETLAVMSGQGGVACIVSLAQVFLAMAESKNAGIPENGHGSTKAAQALWFIGAIGTIACIAALRYLVSHPDYVIVLAPLAQREVSVDVTSKDMTKRVFAKNITLEFAQLTTGYLPSHHNDDHVREPQPAMDSAACHLHRDSLLHLQLAVGSICMIFASSPELNPVIGEEEKDLAGTLAAFSLVAGLAFGSLCSFAVNYAINGNPFGG
ncbi:nucleoside transporter [Trichosporon asahii var. asahii CBS 8904]|uniref:Nucleoside transporter n=1 Tax=Trichosporon asahii var. asahii (strain CBS 8904) TaxID=1220162 RepID=K1W601_TRIAC|nr:nucleoside transporter [Trichosporon asahii var. asahii CBS 8904]